MDAEQARGQAHRQKMIALRDSEVVTRAVEIICPSQGHELFCRTMLAIQMDSCSNIARRIWLYTWGVFRLSHIAKGIDDRYRAFEELTHLGINIPGEEDIRSLVGNESQRIRRLVDEFQTMLQEEKGGKRGRPPDPAKLAAAEHAWTWLTDVGKRPTLTADGDFFRLASIIYEGATNKKDIDLEGQCKTVLQRHRPPRRGPGGGSKRHSKATA
jgi:hypothetical protein